MFLMHVLWSPSKALLRDKRYPRMCMCVCVCTDVYTYVYVYVCGVCVYIYIYIQNIHTQTNSTFMYIHVDKTRFETYMHTIMEARVRSSPKHDCPSFVVQKIFWNRTEMWGQDWQEHKGTAGSRCATGILFWLPSLVYAHEPRRSWLHACRQVWEMSTRACAACANLCHDTRMPVYLCHGTCTPVGLVHEYVVCARERPYATILVLTHGTPGRLTWPMRAWWKKWSRESRRKQPCSSLRRCDMCVIKQKNMSMCLHTSRCVNTFVWCHNTKSWLWRGGACACACVENDILVKLRRGECMCDMWVCAC